MWLMFMEQPRLLRLSAVSSPAAATIVKSALMLLGVTVLISAVACATVARAEDGGAFITTWETTEAGQEIFIPTAPDTEYDFTIDWGDGTVEDVSGTDPNPAHTYAEPGTYQVAISGDFPRIFLNVSQMDLHKGAGGDIRKGANAHKLKSIDQWGSIKWTSMEWAFAGAGHLTMPATDTPDLSAVTSTYRMFFLAQAFDGEIGEWDVSSINDMSSMFEGAGSFNQDIGSWDVSSVTDMSGMFEGAQAFDQDIGGWDVSNVVDMSDMFNGNFNSMSFDQDIGSWDVSAVTDMSNMFTHADAFNQDIGGWDVSSVAVTRHMFTSADAFNQDIGSWDISSVRDASGMFSNTDSFNQDLSGWALSEEIETDGMFRGAEAFDAAHAPPGVE